MANTVIQFKRSTSTAVPANGSLATAEPAYSFNSNKLFIGNTAGSGVVEVGGQYWIDVTQAAYVHANAAFAAANSAGSAEGLAAISNHANAAYLQANTARTHANSAYDQANTAATDAGSAFGQANTARVHANSSYEQANTARNLANTALQQAGGTITGDLVVQGNATFSGMTTYANTQTLLIGDNIITLNNDLPNDVAPSENAGLEVKRGSSANVLLIWNEATDKWTFTNDGTVYYTIPTNTAVELVQTDTANAFGQANTARSHANTAHLTGNNAFIQANTARDHANSAFTSANLAWAHANAAYAMANTANVNAANASFLSDGTVPSARLSGSYTGITGVGTITVGTWNGDTVKVPYGGTGLTTFTQNGILFGNTAGDLKVTAAGTEGQVLQASASGIPQFGMLDGGVF